MSTVSARRIRCKVDYKEKTTAKFTDVNTNQAPELWRGNDVRFEIGIFFDDTIVSDLSNIASLTLSILASQTAGATVHATKTLSTGDLTACTAEEWTAGTGQHALFEFTAAEMAFAAADAYHLVIMALTTDSPAKEITLGATTFKLYEDALE